MSFRLFLTMLIAVLVAAAIEAALPTWWWAGGLRLELLPAVVAWTALTVRGPRWAVAGAFLAGFAHDALSATPFGLTALGYGLAALLLARWQDELERDLPWVQLGAGGLVLLCGTLPVLPLVTLTLGTPAKLALLALLSGISALFCFSGLDWLKREARQSC